MQTVRTTISLPLDIYESLRSISFNKRISFGDVIAQWHKNSMQTTESQSTLNEDLSFFAKVAKSGQKINLLKALREDRNRDE